MSGTTTPDGEPYSLPITLATAEIVDAVPVGAGMINNNTVVGFDDRGKPLITYHKFDARGDTQIYIARRDGRGWRSSQISDWRGFRWDFRGRGSLHSRLFVSGAQPSGRGRLVVRVRRDGHPIDFTLNARTLERQTELPATTLAQRLRPSMRVPEDLQINTVEDSSGLAIAWASRPPNRDEASLDVPPATELSLLIPR